MFFPTVAEVWVTVFRNSPYLCLSTGFTFCNLSWQENAHLEKGENQPYTKPLPKMAAVQS